VIWLLWTLLTLPVRLVLGVCKLSYRSVRFVGLSRIAAFGAGVGAGIALAPTLANEPRETAVQQEARAVKGGDLGATVRHELATSPRTWHLPQPGVTVQGDRVTLTGSVPHDDARLDLLRTAGAILGVRAVDDHLTVVDDPPASA